MHEHLLATSLGTPVCTGQEAVCAQHKLMWDGEEDRVTLELGRGCVRKRDCVLMKRCDWESTPWSCTIYAILHRRAETWIQ